MKRRSILTAALLAPLAPKLAALPAPAEPTKALFLGEQALEMRATDFGTLMQAQLTVWSRDFWEQARRRTFISNPERFPVLDFAADTTKIEEI